MYCIATEASFDAAHFLKNYNGKCKNIHGHRWRVIIRTKADSLQEDNEYDGMITDFKDMKRDHLAKSLKNSLLKRGLNLIRLTSGQQQRTFQGISLKP